MENSLVEIGLASDIPFAERLFTVRQTRQILGGTGKTRFFQDILPQLQSFLDGNKLLITGESIQRYRERRLSEPRRRRPTEQLAAARTRQGDAAARR
jgi:hypothetical protein